MTEVLQNVNRKRFTTDKIDWEIPMTSCHYYQWLKEQGVEDIEGIETKIRYLESLGFDKLCQYVSPDEVRYLRHVENYYFAREVAGR